ncbi:MAG TPA: PHP domain-containing protein [Verrucomicrobiota bacterium]|nr:PHP domain-containing protein [Verrucomicrobiota bacterium]
MQLDVKADSQPDSQGQARPPRAPSRSPAPQAHERLGAAAGALARLDTGLAPIPLVVRSHYSFLNSTLSPGAIVELARAGGFPAVALCDQGNLHGAVEFALAAKAAGVKAIIGVEIRCDADPLWLYVENATGYGNLCRLISDKTRSEASARKGRVESAARGPGLDFAVRELAAAPRDGLLAVSTDAGLARLFPGRFYRAIRTRGELRRHSFEPGGLPVVPVFPVHYARADSRWQFDVVQSIRTLTLLRQPHPAKVLESKWSFRTAEELAVLFGRYPELAATTRKLADRCDFAFRFGQPQFPDFRPPDGSSPRQFLRQLVLRGLEARYGVVEAGRLMPQVEQELAMIGAVGYEEYFLVVWDLLGSCREQGIDWITRGSAADSLVCYCLGISGVCPIRFDLYFRRFLNAERMAMRKLPDIDIDFPHDRKDDVVDLLFAKYGRDHCAVVGGFSTFRARSAFAEVAKVFGVAEREVRRFTQHFPWSMGGGWPESGNSDVGRPAGAGGRLEALLRASPECRDLPLDEEPFASALAMAEFLDGVPRHPKMHPCGMVLSRQPMSELTATFVSQKGYPTTQYDMDAVEAIGLVKMDILAQGGLAVMRDVKAMLRERGVVADCERFTVTHLSGEGCPNTRALDAHEAPTRRARLRAALIGDDTCLGSRTRGARPFEQANTGQMACREHLCGADVPLLFEHREGASGFDDPEVWGLIAGGHARGVHHIESPAMTSLCQMCNVHDIDTLIAIVSVIRPGAANEDKKREFTRRYQGLSAVACPHPAIADCLRSTFGLVVYEEHILQICEAFAGLPGGRADVLRRGLVKDDPRVVAEMAPEFAAAARRLGRTEDEIRRVWELVIGFHGYAFCRAHSTAYGVEAYQSAWLKRYFPAEYMAGVLSNGKGFYRPLVYVLECHRLGIPLVGPCVNDPGPGFRVIDRPGPLPGAGERASMPGSGSGRAIRVPVGSIESLSARTREAIVAERARGAYASLSDFYLRVHPGLDEMEALSKAGALDGFGRSRCEQFWEIQRAHQRWGGEGTAGQPWLLPPVARDMPTTAAAARGGGPGESGAGGSALDLTEPSRLQRLRWEVGLLGFPASGHPLELYPDVAWETYCPVARLGRFVGEEITLCGLVIEDRVHHQATGEPMKFLTLADWTGMIETELFARTYKTYGLATVRYPVLEVTARVEPFENGQGHSLRVVRAGRPRLVNRRSRADRSANAGCPDGGVRTRP